MIIENIYGARIWVRARDVIRIVAHPKFMQRPPDPPYLVTVITRSINIDTNDSIESLSAAIKEELRNES